MNIYVYERLYAWLNASEGAVPYMYVDQGYRDKKTGEIKGRLVTVGIGFMIDPIEQYIGAWGASFVKKNGVPASPNEVIQEFKRVEDLGKNQHVFGHLNFKPSAQLFLAEGAMNEKLKGLLQSKERALKTQGSVKEFFKDFDSFPADAQMGCLSRAYGRISDETPRDKAFNRDCQAQDWAAASKSCVWPPWTAEKNAGHQLMFENAQAAAAAGDTNPQPAFPGRLAFDGTEEELEIDDPRGRPYGRNIWPKADGS